MQSDHAYRLPISNIAYHVYNPEDDLNRAKVVSKHAFQRTMDNYHEHEQLADLFQVELDKRERLVQERKEREKLLKARKQRSTKRSLQGRSQDRSHPQQPERHSLRYHVRSSSGNDGPKDVLVQKSSDGNSKRIRRNSDVSNSDISGDDDARIPLAGPKSIHYPSGSSSSQPPHSSNPPAHSNDRSLSSSPALPLTPSPRLASSDARDQNRNDSGTGLEAQSPNQQPSTILFQPGHMITGRRKRKQAIPVHPSVVERIPGITLRIQREQQGNQLQVEILKNLDDYKDQPGENHSSASMLQATQDMRKVNDSIESGRPGYAFFPTPSSISVQRGRSSPDSLMDQRSFATSHPWNTSISSSLTTLASLTWTSSNGDSVESIASMAELFQGRSQPLSWENFSTRECVVNKVVGKYDDELDILEEVVQDAIARQHYTQQQQQQQHHDREQEYSPAPTTSQRRPSGASTGSGTTAAAAATAAFAGHRVPKSSGKASIKRSFPIRSTRSRTHVSDGNGHRGEAELVTHEDLDLVLKRKRRKKLEGRRRLGSKTSSKDGDDDDDDDESRTQADDDDDNHDVELGGDPDEHRDEDAVMRARSRGNSRPGRQVSPTESDAASERSQISEARPKTSIRSRGAPAHYREESTPVSSESDDAEEDEDYHDSSHKALAGIVGKKRTLLGSKAQASSGQKPTSDTRANILHAAKVLGASGKETATASLQERRASQNQQQRMPTTIPVSVPIVSGDGVRRNKKQWSRGRNTRKEDEVIDTTSEESSGSGTEEEDRDGQTALAKHFPSNRSFMAENLTTKSHESAAVARLAGNGRSAALSLTSIPASPRNENKRSSTMNSSLTTPLSASRLEVDMVDGSNGAISQKSGGRMRARARSFSNTIVVTEKNNFFESAMDVIDQKRRETLAKKRAARMEADERERQEQEQRKEEERQEKELQESAIRAQQQGKAQKIEASNLPKSSKSLPGRVLRRNRADTLTVEDPDCTSCRLELSPEDKTLWKAAQESGGIQLPKTWGTHATLCTTCRQQYLDHHWRCTACFYVPVKEEMATSGASCSRCKAGTWLMEAARPAQSQTGFTGQKNGRRKTASDISV
ncbi:hypothetical protein BGZ98_009067 [Dissophora globulifera]|nr:hypothetical protein BGZ98_009067 [Dissophora globulifera]